MNMLLDGLPDSVEIQGVDVPIVTSYRTGIRFEKALNKAGATSEETLEEALRLYFPGILFSGNDKAAAVDAIIWFYRCGSDAPIEESQGDGSGERSFDIDYDAGYVYAAFKQVYNIDLIKEDIHWWQFRALFDSLPDNARLVQIIGYRTAEVPNDATPKQRQRIEELRRAYALPLDADQRRFNTDLEKILMAGGNPYAIPNAEGARSCHTMEPLNSTQQ